MNISDFASKGVQPTAALVALGLPSNFTQKDIEEIADGLNAGAQGIRRLHHRRRHRRSFRFDCFCFAVWNRREIDVDAEKRCKGGRRFGCDGFFRQIFGGAAFASWIRNVLLKGFTKSSFRCGSSAQSTAF